MIARAPGKLVLSGAYSVLEGAPAIVAAVDRHAEADTSRPPPFVTNEVREAVAMGAMTAAPWFDASALRARLDDGRDVKLGLGSSAAILVASMAADWAATDRTLDRRAMLSAALAAHRAAQGGGSGIDVAASVYGGVLSCALGPDGGLAVAPHALPHGLCLCVLATTVAASTAELVGRVRALAKAEPAVYSELIGRARRGAEDAIEAEDAARLVEALRIQASALSALGDAAGAPIFTPDVVQLDAMARAEGGIVYPSGAGGGDVAIFAGPAPPPLRLVDAARELSRFPLDLVIGADGVHLVSTTSPPTGAKPGL